MIPDHVTIEERDVDGEMKWVAWSDKSPKFFFVADSKEEAEEQTIRSYRFLATILELKFPI